MPDDIAQHADVDLVTIPLHLSFQRLIDLFRASNRDALAETISQFQSHALNEDKRDLLSGEEREILRAMDLSLIEIAAARPAFIDQAEKETLRNARMRSPFRPAVRQEDLVKAVGLSAS